MSVIVAYQHTSYGVGYRGILAMERLLDYFQKLASLAIQHGCVGRRFRRMPVRTSDGTFDGTFRCRRLALLPPRALFLYSYMCVGMCVGKCVGMCFDMYFDMYFDMCFDMCSDMCSDMCLDMHSDMRLDMCLDECAGVC